MGRLQKFLEARFWMLEAVSAKQNPTDRTQNYRPKAPNQSSQQAFHISTKPNCVICHNNHSIRQCPKFAAADAIQRLNIVKSKGLCINCLGAGHTWQAVQAHKSVFNVRKGITRCFTEGLGMQPANPQAL